MPTSNVFEGGTAVEGGTVVEGGTAFEDGAAAVLVVGAASEAVLSLEQAAVIITRLSSSGPARNLSRFFGFECVTLLVCLMTSS